MSLRRCASTFVGRLSLLLAGACAPSGKTVPAPLPTGEQPAPPPSARAASPWRAVPVPPSIMESVLAQPTPEGLLVVDDSGVRWLFPADGAAPRSVAHVDLQPLPQRRWDETLGFVVTAGDDRVYAAKSALGSLELLASLPKDAEPATFRHLDGVNTVRASGGLFVSTSEGGEWSKLPALAGYDSQQAVLDRRGHGVGLFAPETVALTKDRGVTWTPLSTADLSVKSLATLGPRPLLAPGGRRDRFQRSVDLDTGSLERAFAAPALSPEERRLAARRHGETTTLTGERIGLARGPKGGAVAPTVTPKLARVLLDVNQFDPERVSTDGDRALYLPASGLAARRQGDGPLLGVIGEGALPFGGEELRACRPRNGAICGELLAFACATRVMVYRGNDLLASLPHERATAVGFDTEGKLLSFARDDAAKRSTLTRYDLDAVPVKTSQTVVDDLPMTQPAFVGGCHKPATWLVGRTHAARWERDHFAPPEKLPHPIVQVVVGVNEARELVVTTPATRKLIFLPSRLEVETGTRSTGGASFSEDGRHALVASTPRRVLSSSDGGRSFHPIAAPAGTSNAVICGKDRCQLGTGAYREGFDDDERYVAPAAALPAADPPPPSPPPPPSYPVVMTCTVDRDAFGGAPPASAGLAPRLGQAAFAGLAAEKPPRRWAVFGDVTGHAKAFPLPPAPPPRLGQRGVDGEEEAFVAGAVGVTKRTLVGQRSRVEIAFRWDEAAPLHHFVETDPFGGTLREPELFSENGLATQTDHGALLIWGSRAPTERPFPTVGEAKGHGVFVEDAGGTLGVVHELGETDLRVVLVPREDLRADRSFLARRHAVRENALGLAPPQNEAEPWSVILTELLPDGSTELRRHPLAADLGLGPPVIVPGTHAAVDHLMDLPSCGASPSGALVRTFTKARVAIEAEGVPVNGYLQRFLRVTAQGACVERTFLGQDRHGLVGPIVVVGNGGLAAGRREGGLRCQPLVTTPLPAVAP